MKFKNVLIGSAVLIGGYYIFTYFRKRHLLKQEIEREEEVIKLTKKLSNNQNNE